MIKQVISERAEEDKDISVRGERLPSVLIAALVTGWEGRASALCEEVNTQNPSVKSRS